MAIYETPSTGFPQTKAIKMEPGFANLGHGLPKNLMDAQKHRSYTAFL